MKRISSLLLVPGIVFILIGIIFMLLLSTGPTVPVQAALPEDHPPLLAQGALVPTTRHDFFLPGTQPNQIQTEILAPNNCTYCHSNGYSSQSGQPPGTETWTAWAGSMMAQAGRDPVFYAALDIANADANQGGEFCLRCHIPRGWLNGRSTAADGSAMTLDDLEGVQCEVCHRMVDPITDPENPDRDLTVLAAITAPVTAPGNATLIVDPLDYRRGPLLITDVLGFDPHATIGVSPTLQSPYHQEAAFCGSCHNIDNPLLSWDEASQQYQLNPLGQPATSTNLFPIERTYSEWLLSDYNSPQGIYAPQFGGNRTYVSTCQDCHMRDVTGIGGVWIGGDPQPNRDTFPLHDLTGANTWVPQMLPLHPVFSSTFTTNPMRAQALISGTIRARYMLQNAADLTAARIGNQLIVTVTNQSGHKLPTGYVEGRRMWLQVEGYNISGTLVYSSGMYDLASATLTGYHTDPTLKVYESLHGLTEEWAAQLGLTAGHSFHFVLNNGIVTDNRIPPRGYTFDAFNAAGAAPYTDWQPDPTRYADGQYWDTTVYTLPDTVVSGTVRLLHQIASQEYIEFLRDNNPNSGDPQNRGQILYDLWELTEKSRPEIMADIGFDEGQSVPPPLKAYLPTVIRAKP